MLKSLKKVEIMQKCSKLNIFSKRLRVKRADRFFCNFCPPPGKNFMDAHDGELVIY